MDGDTRLVNGENVQEGRLEICINNAWGTVCQRGFSSDEANVVCRDLGLLNGTLLSFNLVSFIKILLYFSENSIEIPQVFINAFYGEGTGPIFLDRLACTGNEANLLMCTIGRDLGITDCTHAMDVSVSCPGMKLVYNIFNLYSIIYLMC